MTDYTVDMFREDQYETTSMLKFLDAVQLPEEEWPRFEVDGRICAVNPNFTEADLAGFFISKYGKVKGTDYVARFLRTKWFIHEYLEQLKRGKLLKYNERRQPEVSEKLLRVILESFRPAGPADLFPESALAGEKGALDYKKVVEAAKVFRGR